MEKLNSKHYSIFGFVVAGLLFSGYIAGVKLFSDSCAFGASCPMFLGYPACYTGFILYAVLVIISIIAILKKEFTRILLVSLTAVSFFGVLFAGKLTLFELQILFNEGFISFVNSLPLCSIGLIFYTAIFVLSLVIGGEDTKVPFLPEKDNSVKLEEVKSEPTVEIKNDTKVDPVSEEGIKDEVK